jgi:hypothetical protein
MLSDGATSKSSEVKLERREADALRDQAVDFLEALQPVDLLAPVVSGYVEQVLRSVSRHGHRHRLLYHASDPNRIQAHLEFASTENPNTYVVAGWLIHECRRPVRWGLLDRESYRDISNEIVSFPRPDLETTDDFSGCSRSGFFALIEGGGNLAGVELTIGTPENPTNVCLPLSDCRNTKLDSYFGKSHQLFRFSIVQRLSTLPERQADSVAGLLESVLNWIREVGPLDGSLHCQVEAGIDHAIYTPSGDCFVEGWLRGPAGGHFGVSASMLGADASRTLLQQSVFRRPDLGGGPEFSGFAFVGRGRLTGKCDPTLLLQVYLPASGEVSYRKLMLRRCGRKEFAKTFWSRSLDLSSINPEALLRMIAFTRESCSSLEHDGNPASAGPAGLSALVLGAPEGAALCNLLILTLPVGRLGVSEMAVVSANGTLSEVWWPNARQMMTFNASGSLDDALSQLQTGLVLIMDVCSMTRPDFVLDVRSAEELLAKRLEASFVVLADEQLVSQSPSRDHASFELQIGNGSRRIWLNLSKGQAIPPIMVRTAALRSLVANVWPQPSPVVILRRFMREEAQRGIWLQTNNVELFYSRPSIPNLPDDAAAMLLRTCC